MSLCWIASVPIWRGLSDSACKVSNTVWHNVLASFVNTSPEIGGSDSATFSSVSQLLPEGRDRQIGGRQGVVEPTTSQMVHQPMVKVGESFSSGAHVVQNFDVASGQRHCRPLGQGVRLEVVRLPWTKMLRTSNPSINARDQYTF